MTLTIIARTDLPCSQCSQAAQAALGNNSIVQVEQGGTALALCKSHASWLPAAELAKALKPAKQQMSPSQYQEQRSA